MAGEWKEKILLTIREKPWKDGKGFGMWVVQKVCDGKSNGVEVRAGMYRMDPVTGEKKLPRDGLNLQDFEQLRPLFKEQVETLLKIPRGTVVPDDVVSEASDAAGAANIEECPF
jgi:hypothetical protein